MNAHDGPTTGEVKRLSLEEAATHLLEECRMVLPGIQALFGFQLIAVFSDGFGRSLARSEQLMHLAAVLCVVLSIALVMAPAAIHRRCEPEEISRRFIEVSSRLLMWSMLPLGVATTLDVYLVAHIVTRSSGLATLAASVAAIAFVGFWAILPARLRLTTGAERPSD